jgi:hypothetical protein
MSVATDRFINWFKLLPRQEQQEITRFISSQAGWSEILKEGVFAGPAPNPPAGRCPTCQRPF